MGLASSVRQKIDLIYSKEKGLCSNVLLFFNLLSVLNDDLSGRAQMEDNTVVVK